jgi:hypothetical protein
MMPKPQSAMPLVIPCSAGVRPAATGHSISQMVCIYTLHTIRKRVLCAKLCDPGLRVGRRPQTHLPDNSWPRYERIRIDVQTLLHDLAIERPLAA